MGTYSDYEQRLLDQQSGAVLDRHAARLVGHVVDVMHKPPERRDSVSPLDLLRLARAEFRRYRDFASAGAMEMFSSAALARELLAEAIERMEDQGPFVVGDGGGHGEHRFRTMEQGIPKWTLDLDEALQFARRKDAELFAAEDEDAWVILPVGRIEGLES